MGEKLRFDTKLDTEFTYFEVTATVPVRLRVGHCTGTWCLLIHADSWHSLSISTLKGSLKTSLPVENPLTYPNTAS